MWSVCLCRAPTCGAEDTFVGPQLGDWAMANDARVVDQDVITVEMLDRQRDQTPRRHGVGHVGPHDGVLVVDFGELRLQPDRSCLFAVVRGCDECTAPGELDRGGTPDTCEAPVTNARLPSGPIPRARRPPFCCDGVQESDARRGDEGRSRPATLRMTRVTTVPGNSLSSLGGRRVATGLLARQVLRPAAGLLALARAVLAVPVGYLMVLTGAAWFATVAGRGRLPANGTTRRMAVLIPAHDEDQVIGDTLRALASLDYPADRFRVHVVADHCSDKTVAIAESAGAEVHEHDHGPPGKGPALQWAIGKLLERDEPADAIVIVDADTVVAPSLLRVIEGAIENGARAVQGQYRVRDAGSSPGAGLRAAALALRHHLRPLGRVTLGASCGLYGNGMAFTTDVLRGREWSGHLTEDVEFQMELLLNGILVDYAPDAVVEAEMPATLEAAKTQNERWERGRLDLARRYVPRLLRAAVRTERESQPVPRIAAVDAVLDHLVPPLSVLAAATGTVAVAGSAVSLVQGTPRRRFGWGLVAALVAHVASGLVLARVPRSVYRSLAHAPRMVVWKVGLWVRMVFSRGDVQWVRTARVGHTSEP